MKIRNGFVSNSSSSSFVLRGICVTKKQLDEIINLSDFEDQVQEIESAGLEVIYNDDNYEADLYIGMGIASTYNRQVEEIELPTAEFDAEIKAKLESKGFKDFELKLWLEGVQQ